MPAQLRRSSSAPSLSTRRLPRSHLRRLVAATRRFFSRARTNHDSQSPQPNTPTPTASISTPETTSYEQLNEKLNGIEQYALRYNRRNLTLTFLQIDMHGVSQMRTLTRQQILTEVRLAADFPDVAAQHSQALMDLRTSQFAHPGVEHQFVKPPRGRARRIRPAARHFDTPTLDFEPVVKKRRSGNRLTIRDMRQMDPEFPANPAIWIREDAIVVSLESVRAVILHNKILVFDPDNDLMQKPMWYIRKCIDSNENVFLPFEFRALEGILLNTCAVLEREFIAVEPQLRQTIGTLPTRVTIEGLEMLRHLEQRLNHYHSRARKVQQALQAVLDDDEDMADMYLTEKYKNRALRRNPLDHDEAEMLLETYLQTVDDVTTKSELLNRAIDHTENLIEIHLDTMQNRLLLVDLIITAITTTISFGTLVTAIFGMNLPLPQQVARLPSSQFYFYGCVFLMVLVMGIGLAFLMRWCRRQGIYRGRAHSRKRLKMRRHRSVVAQVSETVRRQTEEVLAKAPTSSMQRTRFPWEHEADSLAVRDGQLV
ncbi:Magnesium transporter MRS2-like protein [Gracilaria domingensis]|nr:Magnesium transporter MRS2-like protein [Gracilaria domingensis]